MNIVYHIKMNNVLSIEKNVKKHKNYKGNYCSTAQKVGTT